MVNYIFEFNQCAIVILILFCIGPPTSRITTTIFTILFIYKLEYLEKEKKGISLTYMCVCGVYVVYNIFRARRKFRIHIHAYTQMNIYLHARTTQTHMHTIRIFCPKKRMAICFFCCSVDVLSLCRILVRNFSGETSWWWWLKWWW